MCTLKVSPSEVFGLYWSVFVGLLLFRDIEVYLVLAMADDPSKGLSIFTFHTY